MDVVRENPQPSLNWVFADRDGHIGSQASGWFPARAAKHNGLVPLPAWDRKNHWRGLQPSSVLPRIYDPPAGFVATANENINPPGGPQLVTLPLPDYRKRRIDERLAELDQATLEDMQQLQYDVVSVHARDLLQVFLPHMPDGEIKQRLSRWHGNYSPESHEAALFHKLYRHVLLEIFGQPQDTHGGFGWRRMLYLCSRQGFSTMVITAIDRLLYKETSSWWRDRDKGEMIHRAAQQLEKDNDQPWSELNSFRFIDRFFGSQPVGRLLGFQTGELPMAGNFATPFQGHLLRTATRESTFAPSYHFVTDMGSDEAWTNLPGGPSESRFSKYYKTDIERWRKGEYKRLSGRAEEGEEDAADADEDPGEAVAE
jgi:penicillin amidase